jgi:hypothetical protein
MIYFRSRCIAAILLSSGALLGCAPPKQSFLTIQICLGDEKNFKEFMTIMRSVAQSKHMKFIDGSAQTKADLETMEFRKPNEANPVINIGIDDGGGHNLLMGGNLGLPGYQIAMGFGEGIHPSEAHSLADEVVGRLKTRWQVFTVPPGKGAFPLKSCKPAL